MSIYWPGTQSTTDRKFRYLDFFKAGKHWPPEEVGSADTLTFANVCPGEGIVNNLRIVYQQRAVFLIPVNFTSHICKDFYKAGDVRNIRDISQGDRFVEKQSGGDERNNRIFGAGRSDFTGKDNSTGNLIICHAGLL